MQMEKRPIPTAKGSSYSAKLQESFLHFYLPLYSIEVMDDAIEPFSQSRSIFLLDALLSMGNDSIEHTDSALEDILISQSDN